MELKRPSDDANRTLFVSSVYKGLHLNHGRMFVHSSGS